MRERAEWALRYERACWAVWSPGELSRISRKRRKRGYVLELDCKDMRIMAWGPMSDGGWRWEAYANVAISLLDDWIEYGGITRFEDWLLGHLWCIIDMPRDMPPLPKEFWEGSTMRGNNESE